MDEDLCQTLSRACDDCHLAGGCCFEARPPLSQKRIDILMENGGTIPLAQKRAVGFKAKFNDFLQSTFDKIQMGGV